MLFNLQENKVKGVPDGMAIDENDDLWVAVFGGSCILHIDTKEGKLLRKIELPVEKVTSCAFGGTHLEHLYVTTSSLGLTVAQKKNQPNSGSVFKLSYLGVKGQNKANKIRIF